MRRICAFLFLLPALASAQLSDVERKGLGEALYIGNLYSTDLDSSRRPEGAAGRIGWADKVLEEPLLGLETVMTLHKTAERRSMNQLIGLLRTQVLGFKPAGESPAGAPMAAPPARDPQIPEPLWPSIDRLAAAIVKSNAKIKLALSKLTPEEVRTLVEALPRQAAQQPTLKFEFVKQPMPTDAKIAALLAKVDLPAIYEAGQELAEAVQIDLAELRKLKDTVSLREPVRTTVRGIAVELGGASSDSYESTNSMLCIDLGGDDRYVGRYGAGVGYASVLLDLGGNDLYHVNDLSIGAGVLGVGLAYDLGGWDTFRGKSICFGAGLAGVGGLLKDGGDDGYEAVALSQGFAMHGIGLLIDTSGDDRYRVGLLGQGAGRTGGIGWLLDKEGDETYRAGNVYPDGIPEATLAKGQAFAEGGIGLLTDMKGVDAYLAGTYAQGAGLSGGVASLMDSGGSDTYNCFRFGQSFTHGRATAQLIDLAGDDSYTTKVSGCHAFGFDYGVAILLDRGGNDVYAARDSRPAIATANGLALFIDSAGEDRYFGPPGVGGAARGSGSLAIFVDLNGADSYSEGLQDASASVSSPWAVAYDAQTFRQAETIPPGDPLQRPKPGTIPAPGADEMARLFDRAPYDAAAMNRIVGIGAPAFTWGLAHRLAARTLVLAELAGEIGTPAEPELAKLIAGENPVAARLALEIVAEAELKGLAPAVVEAIKKPELERAAARTAGILRLNEAVEDLLPLAGSRDLQVVLQALGALAEIGDEAAVSTAEVLVANDNLHIRKAALALIARFPAHAERVGLRLIKDQSERISRIGAELLGQAGTDSALDQLGQLLKDPRAGVRLQALLSLNGRCPAQYRSAVVELRKDGNPSVAAVAARIDLGR